jgi:hypothetical protein
MDKQHAHQMLDQLGPGQLDAVVRLLEVLTQPVSYSLANAPVDDEPFTEEDRQAVAEAEEWLRHNEPIPHEQVLAEFGLTMADWEKMAEEPLPGETSRQNG